MKIKIKTSIKYYFLRDLFEVTFTSVFGSLKFNVYLKDIDSKDELLRDEQEKLAIKFAERMLEKEQLDL